MSLPPSSAPTATGWSDSCRAGFAPAEEWRLRTAHGISSLREQRHQSFLVSLTIRTWTGRDSARSPETFREPRSRDTSRARCGRPCPSAPLVSRLPLGIVGGAAATAWLPVPSRRLAASDEGGAAETWTARSKASCCWPCQCVGADDGGQAGGLYLVRARRLHRRRQRGHRGGDHGGRAPPGLPGHHAARPRRCRCRIVSGKGGNGIDADARAGGGERCAAAFNRLHGLETATLRLFRVRTRQAPRSRYSDVVSHFTPALLAGRAGTIRACRHRSTRSCWWSTASIYARLLATCGVEHP